MYLVVFVVIPLVFILGYAAGFMAAVDTNDTNQPLDRDFSRVDLTEAIATKRIEISGRYGDQFSEN